MTLLDPLHWLRDTVLRMLPHRARTGLVPVGNPGPDDPVLLTGNFTLTVRRLQQSLRGMNCWLLCADSKGINVWCAAGGGHLTHHDVISVLRTSGVEERVHHRRLVLPQLAATGVERRVVEDVTGWKTSWGPARLEDLPAFLARGRATRRAERRMRFPLWERLEMATMWGVPMLVIAAPLAWLAGGLPAAGAVALAVVVAVGGVFSLLPWLPLRGWRRWLTLGGAALVGLTAAGAVLLLAGGLPGGSIVAVVGLSLGCTAALAADVEGTTPLYGSFINTFHNEARIEVIDERCTGAADCVLVCPRGVLVMDGGRRKVELRHPVDCIQCGACIVQCPEDALRFRYDDGSVVEASTIRKTRMNMLGRRKIRLPDDAEA